MRQRTYYSNGKLLLSGEYLVLHGARALALPLKLGQNLSASELPAEKNPVIHWESFENKSRWFEMKASLHDFSILHTSDIKIANRLINCLQKARELNPEFLNNPSDQLVQTELGFQKEWGFGSSSTLINNIAAWAGVDPFKLLEVTFGGSGYDIACANTNKAILYKITGNQRIVEDFVFDPPFKNQLYFIYLGQKQNTRQSVFQFREMGNYSIDQLEEISRISELMSGTRNFNEFNQCIQNHENILSAILKKSPIKQERFSDFEGEIKSLGAWGGDFVLASTMLDSQQVKKYFYNKGLRLIFKYSDIILSSNA